MSHLNNLKRTMIESIKSFLNRIFKPWHIDVRVIDQKSSQSWQSFWDIRNIPMVGEVNHCESFSYAITDMSFINNEQDELMLTVTVLQDYVDL